MAENELEEGEKKSSKKMIMIVAIVLLLVGGGGAGYYFMGSSSTETEEGGDDTAEEPEEAAEDEESLGANEEFYYSPAKPMIVNFPQGSEASLIQVSVAFLVKGETTIDDLKKHEPMIRNNLLMIISAQSAKELMLTEGKQALQQKMLKETQKVMEKMTGKNKVTNLFFTSFVMQ